MLCEICRKSDATIHLTQVAEGVVRKIHLCESCARESGVDIENPSLTELLLGFGAAATGSIAADRRACPDCGMKQSDFKKNGRLGCPACYSAFEEELAPMLKAMHRQVRHVGKVPPHSPPPEAGATDNAAERVRLQRLLDAAVAREAFEEAARLRDQIRALSPDPKTGTARRAGGKPPS